MTSDELIALKAKVEQAEQAQLKIEHLRKAVTRIEEATQLRLAFGSSLPLMCYATSLTPEPSWHRLIELDTEDTLSADLRAAVLEVVKQRLLRAEIALSEL